MEYRLSNANFRHLMDGMKLFSDRMEPSAFSQVSSADAVVTIPTDLARWSYDRYPSTDSFRLPYRSCLVLSPHEGQCLPLFLSADGESEYGEALVPAERTVTSIEWSQKGFNSEAIADPSQDQRLTCHFLGEADHQARESLRLVLLSTMAALSFMTDDSNSRELRLKPSQAKQIKRAGLPVGFSMRQASFSISNPPELPDVVSRRGGGSPKAEHVVRGHWRNYRSGKRVWIGSHRRGDARIGVVRKSINLSE